MRESIKKYLSFKKEYEKNIIKVFKEIIEPDIKIGLDIYDMTSDMQDSGIDMCIEMYYDKLQSMMIEIEENNDYLKDYDLDEMSDFIETIDNEEEINVEFYIHHDYDEIEVEELLEMRNKLIERILAHFSFMKLVDYDTSFTKLSYPKDID
jgi:hypothetical protein